MPSNCGAGEDSWESLGLQRDQTSYSKRKSALNIHWKDWCWSWSSNTLAKWCEELIHWKRPWCWERLKAGGEGDGRGWDGWMASPAQWTWVWANSGKCWRTGKPGVLQSMGSQRVGHDWGPEQHIGEWGRERERMPLLFNMLPRFVIAFLPRSKYLLISWLQSPSIVVLEPKKIMSVTVSIVSPSICHEVMGPLHIYFFIFSLVLNASFNSSTKYCRK